MPSEYLDEMEGIKNYDARNRIGRYIFEPKAEDMQPDVVYVVPRYLEEAYLQEGYSIQFESERYVVIAADGNDMEVK